MGGLPSILLGPPAQELRRPSARVETVRLQITYKQIPARLHETMQLRSMLAIEGADAKLTGGTRSLMRRLLALNLGGSLRGSQRSASASGDTLEP